MESGTLQFKAMEWLANSFLDRIRKRTIHTALTVSLIALSGMIPTKAVAGACLGPEGGTGPYSVYVAPGSTVQFPVTCDATCPAGSMASSFSLNAAVADATPPNPSTFTGPAQLNFTVNGIAAGSADVYLDFQCTAPVSILVSTRVTPTPVADSGGNTIQAGSVQDPVSTFSGELFEELPPDLVVGGPMPLVFQRYYASYLKRSNITSDLGSNWLHNFSATLQRSAEKTATYISSKGRVVQFVRNPVTSLWEQQSNLDTPYQLLAPVGQDARLYDPVDHRIYTFGYNVPTAVVGKLIAVEDGRGNKHTVHYDVTTGQIWDVTDNFGNMITFAYNADPIPKIATVSSSGSDYVQFFYQDPIDPEYLTQVWDALAQKTIYYYQDTSATQDHALMLQTKLPRLNIPFTQTFNSLGQVVTQTDSYGNVTTLSYVGSDTTITDPLGNTRVQTHTATGELVNARDRAGQNAVIGLDAARRHNSITDRLGAVTSSVYDSYSGKLISVTNAEGNTTSFSYTPRNYNGLTLYDLTGITHADGTTESFVRDSYGNVISHTDPAGFIGTATFNSYGQLLTHTNGLTGTTTYTYNTSGMPATRTDPAGNTTSYTYDTQNRLLSSTFANGDAAGWTYDGNGLLLTSTNPYGAVTSFAYDTNGNLSTLTDPLLNVTTFAYDGNDRLVSATDPLGNSTSQTYDALGRVASTTDAYGNITTYGYNINNWLTSITDPGGNIWSSTYNLEGVPASYTDPLANTTTLTSDVMGRVTQISSPLGNSLSITYDAMGHPINMTDPLNNSTVITRNSIGLSTGVSLSGGAIAATYTRNALGQITSLTDPDNNNWLRAYDSSGRLTTVTDPLGNAQTIVYDSRNRPLTINYPAALGSVSMTWNGANNLIGHTFSDGYSTSYTYDMNSRLTAAAGLTRTYDANGRITNTNGIAITRDVKGRISTMTLATGKTVTYTYDANSRVTSISDWAGGTTAFTYDAAGRLTGMTRPNGVNATYGYDNDNHLILINDGTNSISLARDGKGQITAATRNLPLATNFALVATSANTFNTAAQLSVATYDGMGRLTANGSDSFTWNLASQLLSYTVGGTAVSATYDDLGRRISRTSGGITRNYIWNDALAFPSISIEKQGATDLRYFIHTPDGSLLYSIDAATNARSFYHFDEMGNTVFVTNDAGTVIGSYAYTPFGLINGSTGALDNPFTWQGQFGIMDEGNGLYYIRARYYDANTARFISRDSVKSTSPLKVNPYQYAMDNPLVFVDITGRDVNMDHPPLHVQVALRDAQISLQQCFGSTRDSVGVSQVNNRYLAELSGLARSALNDLRKYRREFENANDDWSREYYKEWIKFELDTIVSIRKKIEKFKTEQKEQELEREQWRKECWKEFERQKNLIIEHPELFTEESLNPANALRGLREALGVPEPLPEQQAPNAPNEFNINWKALESANEPHWGEQVQ